MDGDGGGDCGAGGDGGGDGCDSPAATHVSYVHGYAPDKIPEHKQYPSYSTVRVGNCYPAASSMINVGGTGRTGMTYKVPSKYKYDEDALLAELSKYIESTYSKHYRGENGVQVFDLWEALDGDPTPTHRNMASKYLYRYGRKNGFNRKDILKTIHYCLMLMHYNDKFHKNDELKRRGVDFDNDPKD